MPRASGHASVRATVRAALPAAGARLRGPGRARRPRPPRRRRAASPLASVLAAALAAAACEDDHDDIPRLIPEIPPPPPVPAAALTPLPAPFFVRATDVHAVVGIGVDFDLPFVEAVVRVPGPDGPAPGEAEILLEDLYLLRPDVTFPIDTVVTRLDFFIEILEPRLEIRRIRVEDGAVGTLAAPWQAPGRWLWRMRGVDLLAAELRLGGEDGLPEGFEILRARAAGEIRGRPLDVRGLALDAERNTRFLADATVRLPETLVEADLVADRANEWVVTLAADTFAFRDLVGFIPQLEEAAPGGGAGVVTLAGGQDLRRADVAWLRVASGRSLVAARGTVVTDEPGARFRGARIEAAPVLAEDVERVFGVAIPGGGTWTGWLAGDGTFREGIALRAELARVADGGVSRFAVDGTAVLEPEAYLDLGVRADPLRAADTAFVAVLDLAGPADSLAIAGDVAVRGVAGVAARLDALLLDRPAAPPVLAGEAVVAAAPAAVRRLAGLEPARTPDAAPAPPAPPPPPPDALIAEAEGSVVLAAGGAVDVAVTADSLPLALLPMPEAVDSVRGVARGRARIGGTLDEPAVRGRFTLDDGALFIEPLSMPVEEIAAEARLVDGLLLVDTLGAAAGGGDVLVTGAVRLFDGPRRFDLALHADSVTVKDDEEGDVTASADLALAGPFARPALTGRVHDLHGWIHEDAFRPDSVVDPDDPPYADLARRVPWPRDSELLRRARPDERPPVDLRVVIEVDTAFTVIDEDSELYGQGAIVIASDEEDLEARGVVEILGGFYAFFGERFRVVGGAARFAGEIEPRVALKAEHAEDWAIGDGRIATATAAGRFPPLEFLAVGPAARPAERLTRWSLLPETQDQLASLLIFGLEPQPVTGWRRDPVWRPSNADEHADERSETQAATLLWSYAADEGYDYIPLSRGWLQAGTIQTGPGYPAGVVVGPMIGAGAILDGFEVFVTQALDGDFIPGVRVRANGFAPFGAQLEAFSVPRFYPDTPAGADDPGFFVRRKTGVGLFWRWEFGKGGGRLSPPASRGSPPPR